MAGHALDALLRHEQGDPVPGVVTGEVDGAVHDLQRHVEPRPVLLSQTLLGDLEETLQALPGSRHVIPETIRFTQENNRIQSMASKSWLDLMFV